MINSLFAIAKNTFTETIRQPVYAVIIVVAVLAFILAPSTSMYTLDEDIKLLRELGLSTIFLAGLFIAVFSATGAITEEIETQTITTLLSKPVSRPTFIFGKFFGVAAAVTLAHFIFTAAYLMDIRHGVMETVNDEFDWPVICAATAVIILTFIISALLNYSYDWNFPSSAILTGSILLVFALTFIAFIDKGWKISQTGLTFEAFDVYAAVLLLFGIFILVALAVLFSTRMNVVFTLVTSFSVFLAGLISDWMFGRFADKAIWAKIGSILVPNMQIFWVSDAIYETGSIPEAYLLKGLIYSMLYTAAILMLSIAFFQRRQVG